MKRFILFILMMCCSFVAMSQDTLSFKHSFRLLMNGANPTGEFNHTAFEDDYPDFALEGTLVTASYLRQLNTFISVGPTIHYRKNGYDLDEFVSSSDELVINRDAAPWRSWFTMAEMYLHTRNNGTGNFYLRGSAGASFNKSAQVNIGTTYGDITLPADNASAFAWGIGVGVQGTMKNVGILIELTQLSTSPTFLGKDPLGNAMKYKQPMNTINVGVGVSYGF